MNLKETLKEYTNNDIYPFHMPGHKRMLFEEDVCYSIDMTEVEGVDDLHDPNGPILEEKKFFAKAYGADEAFLLVNGSTSGNLAAIYAATNEGDKILIQRNSHKSIYNAATLRHNRISYLNPKVSKQGFYMAVTPEMVEKALEEEGDIKAVVLTSPSYEGYLADIEEISKICRKNNALLIVDQAHGAHLGFASQFQGAAGKIADITVISLHKTMPSMTQTALLLTKGNLVDRNRIQEALDIFETSSPSYVLMNSISRCGEFIQDYPKYFRDYVDKLSDFYNKCGDLTHIELIIDDVQKKDPGKIVISTYNAGVSGVELARRLREEYSIETELSSFAYVIAMTSIMDTDEGFKRLSNALHEIDKELKDEQINVPAISFHPKKKVEIWKAKAKDEDRIPIEEANGRICASMICIYPPGAPIVIPGEEITVEVLSLINVASVNGLHITGIRDGLISVVK